MYRNIQKLGVLAVLALTLGACKGSEKVVGPSPPLPPVASLTASPTTVYVGENVAVVWDCKRSTTAERSWLQASGSNSSIMEGSETLSWEQPGTYPLTLICNGEGGRDQKSVPVLVKPKPVIFGRIFGFPGDTWFGGMGYSIRGGSSPIPPMWTRRVACSL